MRTVSSDSLSKGDKMSQVETFPGAHNANRQLAEPAPHNPPPEPKLKLRGEGGRKCGWEGRREIQLKHSCFNAYFIYHFNAGTKQIHRPPLDTAGTPSRGRARHGPPFLLLPYALLAEIFLSSLTPPPSATVTPSLPVTTGSNGRRREKKKAEVMQKEENAGPVQALAPEVWGRGEGRQRRLRRPEPEQSSGSDTQSSKALSVQRDKGPAPRYQLPRRVLGTRWYSLLCRRQKKQTSVTS